MPYESVQIHNSYLPSRHRNDTVNLMAQGSPLSLISRSSLEGQRLQDSETVRSEDSLRSPSVVKPDVIQNDEWKPSCFRFGPFVGVMALALAILQVGFSYAILNLSNDRKVLEWEAHWRLKPSVYLAILTAVSNGAISFALAQGAVITFWLRSLRGTTLGQLHRDWAYGSQIFSALLAGKNVSLLAMACVLATLVTSDGPLLQRASPVQIATDEPVVLSVSIAPEVPAYFSEFYQYNASTGIEADFSDDMLAVVRDYSSQAPIYHGIRGCNGSCEATIHGPALIPHKCHTNTTWRNFSAPYTPQEWKIYNESRYPNSRQLYDVSLSSIEGTMETLDFHTYLTGNELAKTCAGSVNSTRCYLRSAIGEYKILVVNDTVTLTEPGSPKLVAWTNNTAITQATIAKFNLHERTHPKMIKTTLGGIVNAFQFQFAFSGSAPPPTKPDILNIDMFTESLFMLAHATNYKQVMDNEACAFIWQDPRPAAMAGMNELMFRIGVYAANNYNDTTLAPLLDPGVKAKYNVTGSSQPATKIFKSDFKYYFAAAAVQILAIALVASTFSGFWRLGRDVSFSPLEIAKAFDAPLLAELDSNKSGENLASQLCSEPVRYMSEPYYKICRLGNSPIESEDEGKG